MPIEIRELIIRTTIISNDAMKTRSHTVEPLINEKQLVDRCVEKVIKLLKKKNER